MKYKLSNGYTLEVIQDDSAESPRNGDNLAQMIFFGKHKHLGDDHNIELEGGFSSREDFMTRGAEMLKEQMNAALVVPIHYYEHSGAGISTEMDYPFNCPWDSGTIGFAVVTNEAIRKEYGIKRVTGLAINKAMSVLKSEVKSLDQWISGEVYGFKLFDENDEEVDSCWGFFGHDPKTNGMTDHFDAEIVE